MSRRQPADLVPRTREEFGKHRAGFTAWLVRCGAEVLEATNEWEVIRFTTNTGIAVVHADKRGTLSSWGNGSKDAFIAFRTSQPWRATARQHSRGGKWKRERLEAVMARDGDTCPFCGHAMPADDMTLEHFVPLATGGSNHLSNLLAAHEDCNKRASHLSVRQKIELIVTMRGGAVADTPSSDREVWSP